MSELKFIRNRFLEKEELIRFQEFVSDSSSKNAILGNTSRWGIIKTKFSEESTDFKITQGSEAGTFAIRQENNRAIDSLERLIRSGARDNQVIPNDNNWYWVTLSYLGRRNEIGSVSINENGSLSGIGTEFTKVLRGQATKVPTKIKLLKADLTTPINGGIFEVVDVIDNLNATITGKEVFQAETNLRYVVIGSTPIGQNITALQEQGQYEYDDANIVLEPETSAGEAPAVENIGTLAFFLARVKNDNGQRTIEDKRVDFWAFNIPGIGDVELRLNNVEEATRVNKALIEQNTDAINNLSGNTSSAYSVLEQTLSVNNKILSIPFQEHNCVNSLSAIPVSGDVTISIPDFNTNLSLADNPHRFATFTVTASSNFKLIAPPFGSFETAPPLIGSALKSIELQKGNYDIGLRFVFPTMHILVAGTF